MLDIGWTELLVIGVVALLVVPPKDLPALLRTVGRYMGQMRRMATDFRSQFDTALRESELAEIRDSVKAEGSAIQSTMRSTEASIRTNLDTKATVALEPAKVASSSGELPTAISDMPAPSGDPAVPMMTEAARAPVAQRAAEAWKASASGDSGA